MKINRANTSFSKYIDSVLESVAQSIVLAMTENPHFPDPVPSIPEMLEAITSFSDATAEAMDGGRIKISQRNTARKVLENQLRQWAFYVNMVANGDRNILTSSGFELEKDAEKHPDIIAPLPPEVSSGNNSGEVVVKITGVKGVRSYVYEYSADPIAESGTWQQVTETRTRCLIDGLAPAKKHWFRVTAIGRRGVKAVSSPVSYIVQ